MSVGGQRASMPTFAVADISLVRRTGCHTNRCGNFRQVNTTVCARDTSLLARVHRLQPPVDRTRRAEDDDDLQIEKAIPRG